MKKPVHPIAFMKAAADRGLSRREVYALLRRVPRVYVALSNGRSFPYIDLGALRSC